MSLAKTVWGPAFWTLLHGFAERLGYQTDDLSATDEAQEWTRWIRYLSDVLPCTICQQHTHIYRRPDFLKFRGEALRNEAREWLYNFHNAVRQNLRSYDNSFRQDDLHTYRTRNLSHEAEIVLNSIQSGVQSGIIRQPAASAWRNHFERLRLLLGLEPRY